MCFWLFQLVPLQFSGLPKKRLPTSNSFKSNAKKRLVYSKYKPTRPSYGLTALPGTAYKEQTAFSKG